MDERSRADRLTRARPSGRPEVPSYPTDVPPPAPPVVVNVPELAVPVIRVAAPKVVVPRAQVIQLSPPSQRFSPLTFGAGVAASVLIELVAQLVF